MEIAHWQTSGKQADRRNISCGYTENNLLLPGKGEPRLILHIYVHQEEGGLKKRN